MWNNETLIVALIYRNAETEQSANSEHDSLMPISMYSWTTVVDLHSVPSAQVTVSALVVLK